MWNRKEKFLFKRGVDYSREEEVEIVLVILGNGKTEFLCCSFVI